MSDSTAVVAPNLQAVFGSSAPVSGAPYSPAVRAGDYLFVSGQLGLDPNTKKPHAEFADQVETVLQNLRDLIEAGGGAMGNIAKTTVFLTDMANFAILNEIYARHFADVAVRPARSTFAVAGLPLGALVEIEAIVYLPPSPERGA